MQFVRSLPVVLIAGGWLALAGPGAGLARADENWDGTDWEELDQRPAAKTEPEERPMAQGPHTLPAGRFAFRASAGMLFSNLGAQAGLLDWLDLGAEVFMPHSDLGNTWMVGGGPKFRIYSQGRFAYALNLRAFGIFYSTAGEQVKDLPEGLALFPSIQIGMKIKEGCFYGEVGLLLYPVTSSSSTQSYVFGGVPAHFGGEIYITQWLHAFINVDIVFSGYFGVFTLNLTGPFNLLEGGLVFIL